MKKVLRINSSPRKSTSYSRKLVSDFSQKLNEIHPNLEWTDRDLTTEKLPQLTEEMIVSFYTPPAERSDFQEQIIVTSDRLVKEVIDSDVLLLGVPIYNFSVPAILKSWIDLIARVGLTFRYSDDGPIGLLEGKKAYIVIVSGGTVFQSEADFASDYLKHFLGFIGIDDVEFIVADQLMFKGEGQLERASKTIAELFS